MKLQNVSYNTHNVHLKAFRIKCSNTFTSRRIFQIVRKISIQRSMKYQNVSFLQHRLYTYTHSWKFSKICKQFHESLYDCSNYLSTLNVNLYNDNNNLRRLDI